MVRGCLVVGSIILMLVVFVCSDCGQSETDSTPRAGVSPTTTTTRPDGSGGGGLGSGGGGLTTTTRPETTTTRPETTTTRPETTTTRAPTAGPRLLRLMLMGAGPCCRGGYGLRCLVSKSSASW